MNASRSRSWQGEAAKKSLVITLTVGVELRTRYDIKTIVRTRAVVLNDLRDNVVAMGIPTRVSEKVGEHWSK